MNKDRIFIVFDEELEAKELEVLFGEEEEIAKNIFKFSKIVDNHFRFCNKLKTLLKSKNKKYDYENALVDASFKNFNKAYFFIKDLDLKKMEVLNVLSGFKEDEKVLNNLKHCLNFFESEEEYESCGAILKIINKIKNFPK